MLVVKGVFGENTSEVYNKVVGEINTNIQKVDTALRTEQLRQLQNMDIEEIEQERVRYGRSSIIRKFKENTSELSSDEVQQKLQELEAMTDEVSRGGQKQKMISSIIYFRGNRGQGVSAELQRQLQNMDIMDIARLHDQVILMYCSDKPDPQNMMDDIAMKQVAPIWSK